MKENIPTSLSLYKMLCTVQVCIMFGFFIFSASLNVINCNHIIVDCSENLRTPRSIGYVWPEPGKEPRQDVDGAIFVSIRDESAFRTTAGSFPQWHSLQVISMTSDLTL